MGTIESRRHLTALRLSIIHCEPTTTGKDLPPSTQNHTILLKNPALEVAEIERKKTATAAKPTAAANSHRIFWTPSTFENSYGAGAGNRDENNPFFVALFRQVRYFS